MVNNFQTLQNTFQQKIKDLNKILVQYLLHKRDKNLKKNKYILQNYLIALNSLMLLVKSDLNRGINKTQDQRAIIKKTVHFLKQREQLN